VSQVGNDESPTAAQQIFDLRTAREKRAVGVRSTVARVVCLRATEIRSGCGGG